MTKNITKYFNQTEWDASREPDEIYEYETAEGQYAFEAQRQGRGDEKAIRYGRTNRESYGARLDPEDNWKWKDGKGDHPPLLYRLPQMMKADMAATVWICEGERDTDLLAGLGAVAVTNPFGYKAWKPDHSKALTGRDVIICEDNDDAGRTRTKRILETLRKVAKSISVVRFTDMPEKSDVGDFLDAGHTLADLEARIEKLTELIFISSKTAEMVDKIEAQLIKSDAEIFGRGQNLSRVVVSERTGIASLHAIEPYDLKDQISRLCDFAAINAAGKQVPAAATLSMANTLLARFGRWQFKEVNGVHTAPLIRLNGDIVAQPGLDDETGLYLVLPEAEVVVGDTREEAEAALKALKGLLSEFPAVTDVDLSVLMAGLLTPLARPALRASPMICVHAHTPGSGKSFYFDVCATLATGRGAVGANMKKANEEETEKRLVGIALEGQPLIFIDNFNANMKSDFLAQLVERPEIKVRILGTSQTPTIVNIFTLFINGNQLAIEGDLVRRVILAHLDAKEERPENRTFNSDPELLIRENRAKWLGYALTIIRAYLKSGVRVAVKPYNSFNDWSKMVREPLIWLGMADPLDSVEGIREEDAELARMSILFAGWPKTGKHYAVGELISAGVEVTETVDDRGNPRKNYNSNTPLHAALAEVAGDGSGEINKVKLGIYLASIVGRICDRQLLKSARNSHSKINEYWLESAKALEPEAEKLAA